MKQKITAALRRADAAAWELSQLSVEFDLLAHELDRRPSGSADAAFLIGKAEEARGGVKQLNELMARLRRLEAAEESAAGAG